MYSVHISTMWTQTKWTWALWLTNDKASYVAQEYNICLFSVAKKAALNKQQIKPCVPYLKCFTQQAIVQGLVQFTKCSLQYALYSV